MLQVGEDAGNKRLQDFLLTDAAQEAQSDATNVLIGVLQIIAQILADQYLCGHTIRFIPKIVVGCENSRQISILAFNISTFGRRNN